METIEELQERNAALRADNAQLRQRLERTRQQFTVDIVDDGHREREVQSFKELIRAQESDAVILDLYDELVRLRRQCAVYADALEESRGNFVEMKRLYKELNYIMCPPASQQSKES